MQDLYNALDIAAVIKDAQSGSLYKDAYIQNSDEDI